MPAFLEIGNEPNIRLWSADPVDHLVSTGQITRWILTLGTGEWSLLGYNDVSNATKLCLQGGFPTHWDQRSMAERFKWLSNTIGDHVPSLIFRKPLAQDASPILMIAAEACCAIPLSVCRDQLPKDSLNLLFGVSEQSTDPLLFHIHESEVVVATRFNAALISAVGALFQAHTIIALEAALLSRFLNAPESDAIKPSHQPELMIARLDHRILVAQRNHGNLSGFNTFTAENPEDVLYYALLLDQGQSKSAYLAGFDQAEVHLLRDKIADSFGDCIVSDWIFDDPSLVDSEPWRLMTNRSLPALARYIIRNPF